MEQPTTATTTKTDANSCSQNEGSESMKFAVAFSLLRSKLLQSQSQSRNQTDPCSEPNALRWKRKAKERKQELLRLRHELREAEDAMHFDLFPPSASCKCFFFDNLGKLSPNLAAHGSHCRFNNVLRRRFLRQVRLNERRRIGRGDFSQSRQLPELNCEDELEQLRASVDFLVELCETVSSAEEDNFANSSHQAVDFILASLKNLLSVESNAESVEGIISCLITRLVRRMCSSKEDDTYRIDNDSRFCIQHVIRKLASESYIGQRAMLSVSQRISVLAESLLFLDPFSDAFPNMHQCMYIVIQLSEFLVSEYFLPWSSSQSFDHALFEEWVTSVLHARKALELLESRNGLYVMYMDRVTGELAKHVSQVSSLRNLNRNILDNPFL